MHSSYPDYFLFICYKMLLSFSQLLHLPIRATTFPSFFCDMCFPLLLLQLLPRHLEECCFNYPQVRFNLIYYGSVTSDPFHTNRLHLQTKVREHTHTRTHTHSHTRTRTHSHTRTCTHMHTNTHRNSHVVSVRTETFPTSLMLINGNWEKRVEKNTK